MNTRYELEDAGYSVVAADSRGVEYVEGRDVGLFRKSNSEWATWVEDWSGTCDYCGTRSEDVDLFDTESAARAKYEESKGW